MDGRGGTIQTSKDTPKRLDGALRGEYQPAISPGWPREQLARCDEGADGGKVLGVEVVVEDRVENRAVASVGEEGGVFVFWRGFGFEEEDCWGVAVVWGHGCWRVCCLAMPRYYVILSTEIRNSTPF